MSPTDPPLRRGEIVRVRLSPVEGSEQGGDRPVLVLSPDLINEHSPVIVVAAITSKKTERIYPFEAAIDAGDGNLALRSKVMLTQIRSIDQSRIAARVGKIADETLSRVDNALKIAVGLTAL